MAPADHVTVTLTPEQWRLIRESLDARYQDELHAPAPWVATKARRERDRAESQVLVGDLRSIDVAIATAVGLEPGPYVRNPSSTDSAPVALGLEQWRVVQSALDAQYHDDDHGPVGGVSRQRRQELRAHRRDRLAMLVEIDQMIAHSTGLEAMLS
jgi:hypothetical protein